MGTAGRVRLRAIYDMLDRCAPGYSIKVSEHRIRVTWRERVYPALPRGEHGAGDRAEIEKGHVKKMVRALGIEECAKAVLEVLR